MMQTLEGSMQGYLHPLYAQSFSDIGEPIFLPKSEGWLIKRQIPGTPYFDAMGPYPLFFCKDWSKLIDEIASLGDDLISVCFTIGPFEYFPIPTFEEFFDTFRKYKDHFIINTRIPFESSISKSHKKKVDHALKKVETGFQISPNIDLSAWCLLYSYLIDHHNISDMRAFSRNAFEKQLAIPGTYFFYVYVDQQITNGSLFYTQNNTAYYHLGASNKMGYELNSSYVSMWSAVTKLSNEVDLIDLGGSTQTTNGELDGLGRFKNGWANETKPTYFCGKILNHRIYGELAQKTKETNLDWFPIYRYGVL